jgi:hypothetical protein
MGISFCGSRLQSAGHNPLERTTEESNDTNDYLLERMTETSRMKPTASALHLRLHQPNLRHPAGAHHPLEILQLHEFKHGLDLS